MDIEDRLHPEQIRSHKAMMTKFARTLLVFSAFFWIAFTTRAQTPTGPQALAFAGLRSVASQGQFNAVKADAAGNLYLLLDQKDGVRILKTDAAATTVLAQAQLGAKGDIGLALVLDPAGNVYVAGTSTSTMLAGTSGAAFANRADASTNSFVAKYDGNLNKIFVTFAGSGRMAATSVAATADAVFLTGSLFAATLPVTANGIQQAPAYGSQQNGFVERFSSDGGTLVYATYLTGALGDTAPAAIVADASDNVYVAGSTSASGYPTVAALVPRIAAAASGNSPTSGFLTKLSPLGDGISFSTFIPGGGVSSLALDPANANLLLSGTIALGQFPITMAQVPLVSTPYQVMVRLLLDGSAVVASTVLAPGSQSFVTSAPNSSAWVDGTLGTPLLPLAALSESGSGFAVRVTAANNIDQTARFGGLPATNPNHASAPVVFSSITTDATGQPIVAGAFTPTASADLIATEQYDLPLAQNPTQALPSGVADTPVTTCGGSLCPGSAGYLAKLNVGSSSASLALSIGASPDITLRNLGSAQATGLQVSASDFTMATNCGATLAAGAECAIALSGAGPGTLSASAANSPTETANIPATTGTPTPIVFSPRELDFGIQTAASAATLRTLVVSNLSQQTQSFTSALDFVSKTVISPFAQASTDCPSSNGAGSYALAPGADCHITFALALNSNTPAGPLQYSWTVAASGTDDVLLTGFAQAAGLSPSATEIDFGTQFDRGLRSTRSLFLSNNSDAAIAHNAVTLPAGSPFSVTDLCPDTLLPHTVCQLRLAYNSPTSPTDDATTLALDEGLAVLVSGQTLPQPGVNGSSVNPSLSVTPSTITFAGGVPVTGHSGDTQTVKVMNTGAAAFSLSVVLTGDFSDSTNCPASLAGNSFCTITLTFTPTGPGTRDGLLAITAGAGTTPAYVTLSGTGTAILPANNGTLDFAPTPVTVPLVQWYKVSQSFSALSVSATGPYKVFLSEDIGYGHANPAPSAFLATASGTCFNCFLGVQFLPTRVGAQAGSLILTSGSITTPYVVSLTGEGLAFSGLVVTPIDQDFGTVPIHSTGQTFLFSLTNLVAPAGTLTVAAPTTTGDFAISGAVSGGQACTGTLTPGATCFVEVTFSPTASGPRSGTLTFATSAGSGTAILSGFGAADPGISLSPNALTFKNVPGTTATQQTITIGNTGSSPIAIGVLSSSYATFTVASGCNSLAPGATCTATVTYTPSDSPTFGVLNLPVTTTAGGGTSLTVYSVPLSGAYTSEDAGLQIIPGSADFGPGLVNSVGLTRIFTVNNLTAKSLALNLSLPRQFAFTSPNPCLTLGPNGSCNFALTYAPLTASDVTGTIFAEASPTDGSANLQGIAYLQGYGNPQINATLGITGPLSPGTGLLDFGQVASGQSATRTLTLTNTSATIGTLAAPAITVRRIVAEPPFLSQTTCGATLAPAQTCQVILTYTPFNQVASGSAPSPAAANTGTLVIESDAIASPNIIDLTGSAAPVAVSDPVNSAPLNTFSLSDSSLTFSPTATGNASPAQTVTLTNTGTVNLNVIGLKTTPDFTVTNNCTQTLLPAATCTLSITFTPQLSSQATALHTSALEIETDAGSSLEFITLFALSSPASLGVIPTSLNFGTLTVGLTATLPVQITNTGAVPVAVYSITATGDYASTNNCGATLAPATSCTVQVTFSPTASGTRSGALSIATSASALPLSVALTGIGTQSQLQIAPASLAFGPIAVGASANLSVTLANTGTASVTRLGLAVTGDYAVTVPCPAVLAPSQSCTATVTFTPTSIGARPGILTVTSSDASSPTAVPLTGTGVQNGSFLLTVNGAQTGTASVRQGYPATYTLTVTPTGSFAGQVVLNCTPLSTAQFASCSILPSGLILANGSAQNAILTINTVTSIQTSSLSRPLEGTLLCLLAPALFVFKRRRRQLLPLLGLLLCALLPTGCGGGPNPNLRYTLPGSYQYQVTASSTSGTQIIQSLTVTVVITN